MTTEISLGQFGQVVYLLQDQVDGRYICITTRPHSARDSDWRCGVGQEAVPLKEVPILDVDRLPCDQLIHVRTTEGTLTLLGDPRLSRTIDPIWVKSPGPTHSVKMLKPDFHRFTIGADGITISKRR